MKWVEVVVKTSIENEDLVSNVLYQAGATGLAIEDPQDIIDLSSREDDWDFIDHKILEIDMGTIIIKAYYEESEALGDTIIFIKENIEGNPFLPDNKSFGKVEVIRLENNDWAENWKKYYKPIKIGRNLIIKPSWEPYDSNEEDIVIELDPGMAFGTGTHETTIMCSQAIEAYLRPGDNLLDVGCGSGILSIVGAKLGARQVIGVDMDAHAVRVAKENIDINEVKSIVEIREGNLLDNINEKFQVVVANIIAEVIVGISKDIGDYLEDKGIFIASGIILDKIDLVENALIENGFKLVETEIMNEWACIIAKKA